MTFLPKWTRSIAVLYLLNLSITIFVFADVLREFDTLVEVIIPQLPDSFKGITDADGKSALIWILGEYGEVGCNSKLMFVEISQLLLWT